MSANQDNPPANEWLAQGFEAQRPHLRAVAYRMLGSQSDADDAVQEAWLRLSRADASGIENLGGWLTTVIARVCLDMLRSRATRHEEPLDVEAHDAIISDDVEGDPEREAVLSDSLGVALLVVLETLTPSERLAFVLHDLFGVSFDEIAPIVGRSPAAARQLASRARRRVRGAAPEQEAQPVAGADHDRQREIVQAFLAASRGGDFAALLEALDPEVTLRADEAAIRTGATSHAHGAEEVAAQFAGRARAAQPALIDGVPGLIWAQGGQTRVVFAFTFAGEKISAIDIIADPDRIRQLAITVLDE